MGKSFIGSLSLPHLPLWEKLKDKRQLISFELELTARCNNNCRHCYINLPAGDQEAKKRELSLEGLQEIADEACSLGALWCLLTGGEPLLREDFFDIYLALKKKGLLVSLFTNATLLTKEHVRFFRQYPPRDIEVSVYGVTKETYEQVTRRPGSFEAFCRGLDLLRAGGIKVRLKAMALRSNSHELAAIARFCRAQTMDFYRFDPFLNLRYDHDTIRNAEIIAERLAPEEIVNLERSDPERFQSLKKHCDDLIFPRDHTYACDHLFSCGAGNGSFVLSYDGLFRLCSSLWHPDCVYDLKDGSLREAFLSFVPRVHELQSHRREFLASCHGCQFINLCMWCPAHASLETGELDAPVDYFCRVAHARAEMLQET
ncbi:MAG: radical SAM protein [Deltaproteobacteria bacterium]|nr:radical SAM protein [Deltaproteobacteria bacterium]